MKFLLFGALVCLPQLAFGIADMFNNPILNNLAISSDHPAPHQASMGADLIGTAWYPELQLGLGYESASLTAIHYMGDSSVGANDSSLELNNIFIHENRFNFLASIIGGYTWSNKLAYAHPYLSGSFREKGFGLNLASGVTAQGRYSNWDIVSGIYQHVGDYVLLFLEVTTIHPFNSDVWQMSLATGSVFHLGNDDFSPQLYLGYLHNLETGEPGVSLRISALW